MASLPPSLSSLLFLTLALILISISPAFSTSRQALDHNHHDQATKTAGVKITLNHIDSGGSFTKSERLNRAVQRSGRRLQKFKETVLTSSDQPPTLKTTVYAGDGDYLMNFSIGTPPKPYNAIMDTGSDLVWTQCQLCPFCAPQNMSLFNPANSSSFSSESCTSELCLELGNSSFTSCSPFNGCAYFYGYGSGETVGYLGTETFTFEGVSVASIGFGCGLLNLGFGGTDGLIGLGRGPLSLISQLGETNFSYCLTSFGDDNSSTLLIGSQPSVNSTPGVNTTTPLLQNPWISTFYYLSLEGITIGSTRLPVNKTTFQINPDGSGGVILDSGTTITFLEYTAYDLVRNALINQTNLPLVDVYNITGLDTCFKLPTNNSSVVIPQFIFHFTDLDLNLPTANYMLGNSSIFIPGLGVTCLGMAASYFEFSIYGNIQQANYVVEYDLSKETISFIPKDCDNF